MTITTKFNKELLKVPHYKKHPQMIPFVGENYGKVKKLLIIGESHFCPENTDNRVIENWYDIDNSTLNSDIIDFTSTSELLKYNIENNRFKGSHTLFKNMYLAISEAGFKLANGGNILTYISFMNFFQRPEKETGETINVNQKDVEVSNQVLSQVIKIINPEFLFFTSSKSYNCFDKSLFDENRVGHSCHPTSKWWNMKSSKYTKPNNVETITGKESFVYFIKENKIFL